jgi:hypothetical protein
MKLNLFIIISFTCCILNAQQVGVGINTNEPKATLDINGNTKIREVNSIQPTETVNKILAITDENEVVGLDESSLVVDVEEVRSRTLAFLPKTSNQGISGPGILHTITFNGQLSGINITNSDISISQDGTISLIKNKTFKLTASLGVNGASFSGNTQGRSGYLSSQFILKPETVSDLNIRKSKIIYATKGFIMSSTYPTEVGSFNPPIIVLITGDNGAEIELKALFGSSTDETTYYISGDPTNRTLGSYLLIEEL